MTQPSIVIIDYQVLPRITSLRFHGTVREVGLLPSISGGVWGIRRTVSHGGCVSRKEEFCSSSAVSQDLTAVCICSWPISCSPEHDTFAGHRRLHHSGTWCSCGCIYYSFHRCFLWAKREILYIFKFTDKLHGIIYLTKSFNKITK